MRDGRVNPWVAPILFQLYCTVNQFDCCVKSCCVWHYTVYWSNPQLLFLIGFAESLLLYTYLQYCTVSTNTVFRKWKSTRNAETRNTKVTHAVHQRVPTIPKAAKIKNYQLAGGSHKTKILRHTPKHGRLDNGSIPHMLERRGRKGDEPEEPHTPALSVF